MHPLKYRRLSLDELSNFEKEFIQFLVISGITADDWIKIKTVDQERANELIDAFSDTIIEGLMQKTQYFDYISPKMVLSYHVDEHKASCYVLIVKEGSSFVIDENDVLTSLVQSNESDISLTFATKSLYGDRNIFVFEELAKGCLVSNGSLFENFSKIKLSK